MIAMTVRLLAAALLVAVPQVAMAQSPAPADAQQTASPTDQLLQPAQLDALVAPIALYPDTLLAEILMASTYPLEVVEADRWVKAHKNLIGDALKAAVDQQKWDDSVKSLVATPSVLDMMSTQLDWTQALGNAVLAQQPDVMNAVQRLRAKAQANNKLTSNQQQTVSTEQQDGTQAIVITPTEPDMIYVPYYDPSVVYGPWLYPDYPPYYWPAPGYIAAGIIATGIAFGAGYALARWGWHGYRWGGGLNWGNRDIFVNRNINNVNANNWTHNPMHRQGMRYTNAAVAAKFGGNRGFAGPETRMEFRGRAGGPGPQLGAGVSRPAISGGGVRPNVVNRPMAVTRPPGNALGGISSGHAVNIEAARGRASLGGVGGGFHMGGGGGGFHGGGGGGRRSDIRLKHDIALLGRLDNGIGLYRFVYNGDDKAYVGVMAQEVQAVMPEAVVRGHDGYLRVFYDRLGVKFQTYDAWVASRGRVPVTAPVAH